MNEYRPLTPGDSVGSTTSAFVPAAPQQAGGQPRRRSRLRGRAAVEANARERGSVGELLRAGVARRLAQCAVCGANVYDATGKRRSDVRWRTVEAWRVQVCDAHARVGVRAGFGRARFFEIPPEAT